MIEIKNRNDMENLVKHIPYIIEYGMPNTCIPCKYAKENLEQFEKNKKYNLNYFSCSDIDMLTEHGVSNVPQLELVTDRKISVLTDGGVAMDEDELSEWIDSNI